MKHFLAMNLAVIVLIGFVIYLTNNALALLGLFYLTSMPYEPPVDGEEGDDAVGSTMGFLDKD